jgi:hypothetical protein
MFERLLLGFDAFLLIFLLNSQFSDFFPFKLPAELGLNAFLLALERFLALLNRQLLSFMFASLNFLDIFSFLLLLSSFTLNLLGLLLLFFLYVLF